MKTRSRSPALNPVASFSVLHFSSPVLTGKSSLSTSSLSPASAISLQCKFSTLKSFTVSLCLPFHNQWTYFHPPHHTDCLHFYPTHTKHSNFGASSPAIPQLHSWRSCPNLITLMTSSFPGTRTLTHPNTAQRAATENIQCDRTGTLLKLCRL